VARARLLPGASRPVFFDPVGQGRSDILLLQTDADDPGLPLPLHLRQAMILPRDPVELHSFCQNLGYDVPTVAPTSGQQAPFEALADLCLGDVRRAIIMSSRGSGKSQLLALLAVLLSLKEPGTVSLVFGQVERQSSIVMDYAGQLARRLSGYADEILQSRVTFHNNSKIVLSSAGAGSSTVGLHGHLLLLDELDTFDFGLLQNCLLCLSGDDDHPGRVVGASTRYGSGLLDQLIADGSWHVYQSDFWTSLKPCQECTGPECPLFLWETPQGKEPFCQGRALWSQGFRPLEDVLNLFRATSRETWRVQQMLSDPMGAGRIWQNFNPDLHLGEPPEQGPIGAGLDWGQSPAIVVGQLVDGVLWVIEEMGGPGVRLEDLRAYLLDLKERFGEFTIWVGAHDQLTSPMTERWADDDLQLIPVVAPFSFRGVRHDEVRKRLDLDPATGQPGLMFSEACTRTVRQVHLAKTTDEQGRRSGDDFRDALSYLVAGVALSGGDTTPGGALMR